MSLYYNRVIDTLVMIVLGLMLTIVLVMNAVRVVTDFTSAAIVPLIIVAIYAVIISCWIVRLYQRAAFYRLHRTLGVLRRRGEYRLLAGDGHSRIGVIFEPDETSLAIETSGPNDTLILRVRKNSIRFSRFEEMAEFVFDDISDDEVTIGLAVRPYEVPIGRPAGIGRYLNGVSRALRQANAHGL